MSIFKKFHVFINSLHFFFGRWHKMGTTCFYKAFDYFYFERHFGIPVFRNLLYIKLNWNVYNFSNKLINNVILQKIDALPSLNGVRCFPFSMICPH